MTDRPAPAQPSRDDKTRSDRDDSSDKTGSSEPSGTTEASENPEPSGKVGTSGKGERTAPSEKPAAAGKGAASSRTAGSDRTAGSEETAATDRSGKSPLSERVQAALAGPGTSSAPGQPAAERGSTRTARLRLTRLDPWSVMKTAFLLSIAFGIVTVVAVAIVWGVLGAAGVWEAVNTSVQQIVGGDAATDFDVENYLGADRVLGFTMLVAVVDVVLITAIATLTAFLYNLAAALLGGLEVTLAEDDR